MTKELDGFDNIIKKLIEDLIKVDNKILAFLDSYLNKLIHDVNGFALFLRRIKNSNWYFRLPEKIQENFSYIESLRPHLTRQLKHISSLISGKGKKLMSDYFLRVIHALQEIDRKHYKRVLRKNEVRDIYILTKYDVELKDLMEEFEEYSGVILGKLSIKSIVNIKNFERELNDAIAYRNSSLKLFKNIIEFLEVTRNGVYVRFEIAKRKIEKLQPS